MPSRSGNVILDYSWPVMDSEIRHVLDSNNECRYYIRIWIYLVPPAKQ